MKLAELALHKVEDGVDHVFLRSGISLCLQYSEPASAISHSIADILEAYVGFIPAGALQTYLAANGTWKALPAKAYNRILRELRSTSRGENAEFHLGQEPPANVGEFGAHFSGSPLSNDFYPLETCILYLEFPFDISQFSTLSKLEEFIHGVARVHDFDSGFCGYAFKNLQLTFRQEAFEKIGELAPRYLGLDISNFLVRLVGRGRVSNLSWINLFGKEITDKLGGVNHIRSQLPDSISVAAIGSSAIIRVADVPIIGDVNRGAKDALVLGRLSELTRPLRIERKNLGPDDDEFAERWLSRFDNLK